MKSKLLILLFAVVSVIIVFNEDKQHHNQFTSDTCGYYLYLPATFIYHDLRKLSFYPSLDSEYHYSLSARYSLFDVNGNKLNKYPCGVAIFELPFFLVADTYCRATGAYKANGFTLPYQLAGIFSNIFWAISGLFVLRILLRKYFSDTIVFLTLFGIAFGSNLYAYTAFAVGMSHPISFFLFANLLYLTDIWYRKTELSQNTSTTEILLGLTTGWIFIVRPINIIVIVVLIFWKVYNYQSLKARMKLLTVHIKGVVSFLLFAGIIASLQFLYWHYITGHWFFYSYGSEGFDFQHPNIWKGLFSYRKGWFVYTPLSLVALAGLYCLWKKDKRLVPVLILFFGLMIYSVFSWREWWYGGGFGCRPLIETMAMLSLPLAALTENFYLAGGWQKVAGLALIISIAALNIFQTYQYSMGLIHWSRMTKEYYWKVFGKIEFDRVKNEQYLIPEADQNRLDK